MPAQTDAKQMWNKRVILAAIESTYGDDSAPTGSDALKIYDAGPPKMAGGAVELKPVRPHLGAAEKIPVDTHRTTSFWLPPTGSGSAGTAPGFDTVLRMSGFASTAITGAATIANSPPVASGTPSGAWTYTKTDNYAGTVDRAVSITCTTGGASGVAVVTIAAPAIDTAVAYSVTGVTVTDATPITLPGGATITPTLSADFVMGDAWTIALTAPSVRYNPVSEGFESASLYYHLGGARRRLLGARGKVGFGFEAGQVPKISCDAAGLWEAATTTAPPTPDFSKFTKPTSVSEINTPLFTLFGHRLVLKSLSADNGAAPVYRGRVNQSQVVIGDRPYTGRIVADLPENATWDPEAAASTGDMGVLTLIHGTAAGNIFRMDAGRVQIANVELQEDASTGITTFTADLSYLPGDAGNDDLILSCR